MEDQLVSRPEWPLVSIILICYNQQDFVVEALDSVFIQEYPDIELIVLDNGSVDKSAEAIESWLVNTAKLQNTKTIYLETPVNYCMAFNHALRHARGKYVVDLSGDDVLFPHHISKSVSAFGRMPSAAISSSNAELVNEKGKKITTFFSVSKTGKTLGAVPEGDVYERVVMRYCVCTPTMVFNTEVLKKAGGYNEALVYEDFDIMTRLARNYPFVYSDHIGVQKRIHQRSFSRQQYQRYQSKMLRSTLDVCKNIAVMNRSANERKALMARCMHEAKHALASSNFEVAEELLSLAETLGANGLLLKLYKLWHGMRLDLSYLYALFRRDSI